MALKFITALFAVVTLATAATVATLNVSAQDATATPNLEAPKIRAAPFTVERLALAGPVTGILVKVDLSDPRVQVKIALADNRDPDGDGPSVGTLDTPSNIARKNDFDITLNASYFAAPIAKDVDGKKIRYFVGNGAHPVGWHFSDAKLITSPASDKLRATMIVHEDGRITIKDQVKKLPADTKFAVSGNAMMLTDGVITTPTPPANDTARNPRSAVGLSANGKTFIMLAIDGRSDKSRGVTLAELAAILKNYGAENAINLDGGGSTSLIIKDPGTGVFSIANQPSDLSTIKLPIAIERPVIDVIGIKIGAAAMAESAAAK